MVEAFERFMPELPLGELSPQGLLQGSATLVEACLASGGVFVTDSYLPGFWYLYGRYPEAQIATFSARQPSRCTAAQPSDSQSSGRA